MKKENKDMESQKQVPSRPVWVEVDLSRIAHNMSEIRRLVKEPCELMAVVKADGYGHGALAVAHTVLGAGASRLAVAIPEEGIALREGGISAPILVLGSILPGQAEGVVRHLLTATVFDLALARALSAEAARQGKNVPVHLKVDTGMGRIGLFPDDIVPFINQVMRLPHLVIEGVYTHFATADAADKTYARQQLELFEEVLKKIKDAGISIPLRHAANSAAILNLPESHLDMVRPGIILYGINPLGEKPPSINLEPALSWKAKIVYVKQVPGGTCISYGRTHITQGSACIATLPLGYADGLSRALSNRGEVLIRGQRAPIVGRVCMDQCMVDISRIEGMQIGDEAVLIGSQGKERLSAEEMARIIGTIGYEIVCNIGQRVPRVYVS
jgi:alanine racemase